jgi:superoxide dismutase, Cu-Zn family
MRATIATVMTIPILAACGSSISTEPQQQEMQAQIQGKAGWTHLNGQATVSWIPGAQQFSTSIVFSGDEPGAVRPWHVHHNSCAVGGGIVGVDGDYPRLNIGAAGTGTAATTVPFALSLAADYHVNVHLSNEQMDVIIACGDLNGTGAAGQNAGPGY